MTASAEAAAYPLPRESEGAGMANDHNVSYATQIVPGLAMTALATVAAASFMGRQDVAERGEGWQMFAIVAGFVALVMCLFGRRLLHPDEDAAATPVFVLSAVGVIVALVLRHSSAEVAGVVTGAMAGGFAGFTAVAIIFSIYGARSQRRRATEDYDGPDLGGTSARSKTSKLS